MNYSRGVASAPDSATDPLAERRARRAAQRARRSQIRRRRLVALAGSAALVALGLWVLGGDDDASEPAAPAPAATPDLGAAQLSGLRLIAGWDGPQPPRGLKRLIGAGGVAGVILFADNVGSRKRTRKLIAGLQAIERPQGLDDPLLVMVDQEGGQVRRLPGPPSVPAEQMGARGQAFALREGQRTAADLRSLGFNVDLAPVLDVARPGGAIDREQREFGSTAEQVISTGVDGFAAGLTEGGVAATAKHFPGLGAAQTNTDLAAQSIDLSRRRLQETDEAPFAAFADAGGALVMLSLATYPAYADRPAAFSSKVIEGELRDRLGFDGVTITDGLGAAAAAAFGDLPAVALAAEAAGNDLLLYSDWRAARDVWRLFQRRLRRGELEPGRFEAAATRVLSLRAASATSG